MQSETDGEHGDSAYISERGSRGVLEACEIPSTKPGEYKSVVVREILLLTGEKQLARRVVMKELADYISLLCAVIDKVIQHTERAEEELADEQDAIIHIDMHHGGHVSVEARPQLPRGSKIPAALLDAELIAELTSRLEKVTPAPIKNPSPITNASEVATTEAAVRFQILFSVKRDLSY